MEKNKFGSFDLGRQLSNFEMKYFDDFMKPINSEIPANEISITDSVEYNIQNLDNYLNGKF